MIYAGTITKVEESIDGSPMYTVATPNGAVYFPCFNASVCGGFDGKYMFSPIDLDAEVIIARVNKSNAYFIISTIADISDQIKIDTTSIGVANTDSDYVGLHHEETEIRNTNSRINLSPVNDLTMSAPNVRLQLDQGIFRVSQQGTSANQVLNGQPFLDALFSYIATMEARINDLSDVVKVLGNEILAEFDALTVKSTSGTITAEERVRLVQLALLGVGPNPAFRLSVLNLADDISSSTVAKSDCEATKNSSIKIP